MRRSKLISLPLSLALATSSFATGFGASAESNDYLEFSMTNIEYDASSEEQWIDIFVTHAYGKDLEMDGLYAVQGAIYYQTEYFEFVKGDTASCYGTLTGNDKNNGEIVADGKFDIPESYDGAYYFTIMSSGNEINPIIANEGDLVFYFGVKVKDNTPDGVYEFIFDTSRTKGINMECMYTGESVPLVLNNGTLTIKREKQTTLPVTTTTTTTTTTITTKKPVTTTTTTTTTKKPVTTTTTTTTTKKPVTTTTITTTKKPVTTTTTTTTKKTVTTTTITTTKKPVTTTTTTTKKPVTTTTTTTTKKPVTTTTTTTTKKPVTTTTTTTTTKKPVTTTTITTTKKPVTTTTTTTTKKPVTTTTITTTKKPVTTTTTTTKKPVTTTTTTKPVVITTTTTTTASDVIKPTMKGDANCDNVLNIADVVSVKCYLINSKNYSLSKQGIINADVHLPGNGLNIQDVIAIQKYTLKLISSFDNI